MLHVGCGTQPGGWTAGCREPGTGWDIAHCRRPALLKPCDLGVTTRGSQHCSCCSGSSLRRGIPTSRLSQGPNTCQQLTRQEIASPLCLPTFLPEHSLAQGVAGPQKICRWWLTNKQKLPLDKKPHRAIGNLFVLGGAFFLSLLSPPATPHPQSLHCWLRSFLPFFFFLGMWNSQSSNNKFCLGNLFLLLIHKEVKQCPSGFMVFFLRIIRLIP